MHALLLIALSQFPYQPTVVGGVDPLGARHAFPTDTVGHQQSAAFSPPAYQNILPIQEPSTTYFSVASDLNSDGNPDLLVTVYGSNIVNVYLANADGSLQAPQSITTGNSPRQIAMADFNKDGCPDFAVTNKTDGTVGVYLNSLSGTKCTAKFTRSALLTGVSNNQAIGAGVFSGGVNPGIVIASRSGTSGLSFVGNGDGTFAAGVAFTGPNSAYQLAFTDINTDGYNDIVLVGEADQVVGVLYGNGSNGFNAMTVLGATPSPVPSAIVVADFNNDAIPDVAITDRVGLDIFIANDNGLTGNEYALGAPVQYTYSLAQGEDGQGVAYGDFNGDGYVDLAVTVFNNNTGFSTGVNLFSGNGTGTFVSTSLIPLPGIVNSISADIGYPVSTVFPTSSYPGPFFDINHDGRPDLACTNIVGGGTTPGAWVLYSSPIQQVAPTLGSVTYVTPAPGTNAIGSRGPETQSVTYCNSHYATYLGTLAARSSVSIDLQYDSTPIWVGGPKVVPCPGCASSISDAGFVDGGPGIVGEEVTSTLNNPLIKQLGTQGGGLFCIKASGAQDGTYDGGWTVTTELP